jgi:rubrerythrin
MEGEVYKFKPMYPEFLALEEKESMPAAIKSFKYALEYENGHYDLHRWKRERASRKRKFELATFLSISMKGMRHLMIARSV